MLIRGQYWQVTWVHCNPPRHRDQPGANQGHSFNPFTEERQEGSKANGNDGGLEGEWILYVDGPSNVRGARVGIVLTSPTGNTASRAVRCNFKATTNESEYKALIAGLTLAHQMGAENIQVFGDSQLIINQV